MFGYAARLLFLLFVNFELSIAGGECPEFDAMKNSSFNQCDPQQAGTCGFNSLSNIVEVSFTPEVYGILSRSDLSSEAELIELSNRKESFFEGVSLESMAQIGSFGERYGYCDLESELNSIKKDFTLPQGLGGCDTNAKIIETISNAIESKELTELNSDLFASMIFPSQIKVMHNDHKPHNLLFSKNNPEPCSTLVLGELMRRVYKKNDRGIDFLKNKLNENLVAPSDFSGTKLYSSKNNSIIKNRKVHSFFYNLCKTANKFKIHKNRYEVTQLKRTGGADSPASRIINYFKTCKSVNGCDCAGIHVASGSYIGGHAFAIKGILNTNNQCSMIVYDSNPCAFDDFFKKFAGTGSSDSGFSLYNLLTGSGNPVTQENIKSGCKYTLPVRALNLNETVLYGYCKKKQNINSQLLIPQEKVKRN